MSCFPLCPDCEAEYRDPLNRRFHAQPNACPVCGPSVWLVFADGERVADGPEALERLARMLAQNAVAAIKGLGGFHLACDAASEEAVQTLRTRKNRPDKPLAVMVPDLDTARKLARISKAEAALLQSRERPITLLRRRTDGPLAPGVSPDTDFVGLMLPYTPLHHVLLEHFADTGRLPALVMTSGNMSSEPICLGNREALDRLADIADVFLLHNRDILIRTDDSVARAHPETGATMFLRRARGYTPSPVFLAPGPEGDAPCVLGTGPELKATLCLTKGDQAFVSQHIGDMENLFNLGFYKEIRKHLQDILQVAPACVVRDLHPDYMTTQLAGELAAALGIEQGGPPLPVFALQHHVAHIHAALAENRHQGPVVGLALDGTGYGEDGTIWGGECLLVNPVTLEHRRLAHFSPCALPGGEAAVREPWRIAQAMLWELGDREPNPDWPWSQTQGQASRFLPQMLERNLNCPRTTSCGRLFDAVSALLDLKQVISYEGQAAIVLEAAQDMRETGAYPCPLRLSEGDGPAELETRTLFAACRGDRAAGTAPGVAARRFHLGLVAGLADMAAHFAAATGTRHVALSGGVMQNLTMAVELPAALERRGLIPLTHSLLPPGDACISLGQAAWGRRKLLLEQD